MLAVSHPQLGEAPRATTTAERGQHHFVSHTKPVRLLARGEILFQAGDTRAQLYRVERGALCHYVRWNDRHHEIIEFAFPGDIVGFGQLEAHISTAQAIAETLVSPVSVEAFERAVEADAQLASRLSAAIDREFDFLRARAVASGHGKPTARLASFLSALSHIGANEGRDPALVSDEINSGFVAGHLGLTLDGLARALRDLESRGLVRATPEGLRIADVTALEKFVDAA